MQNGQDKEQDKVTHTLVYAPNEDSKDEEKDNFYQQLDKVIKENKKSTDHVIIMGDLNAKIGEEKVQQIVGPYGLGSRNNNSERLIDFVREHKLMATNTWEEKERFYAEKCKELEELDKKHSPKLYNKIEEFRSNKTQVRSNIQDKNGKMLQNMSDMLIRWQEYTEELYCDPSKQGAGVKNYHGETLSPIMESELIKSRITPIIERNLTESQYGFRKGKETRDAIHLRLIGEKMIDKGKMLYICFIDYTKAFDRVQHNKLLEILEEAEIPFHERRIIANIPFFPKNAYWKCKHFMRRNISMTLKKRLLNCYVKSVMSCGSETWTYTKERLNIKERWADEFARRKMRYAGHKIREKGNTIQKITIEGILEGTRPRGRPRRSWTQDVKEWSSSSNWVSSLVSPQKHNYLPFDLITFCP
ncbi:uncharacterized protein LOC134773375 [Penaeus indicus]|uniref:uncharacterized protein LOC134773375 n=1 Tax=Penaeus indicus TaxID=29960 RepID=UPI00300D7B13